MPHQPPEPPDLADRDRYLDLVHECYVDETSGAAFFERLRDLRAPSDRTRAVLDVLATLEHTMCSHLAILLERHARSGDGGVDPDRTAGFTTSDAARYGALSWPALLAALKQDIQPYLLKYQRTRDAAPAGDRAVLDLLVQHELAIEHFLDAEQAGDHSQSLRRVWDVLRRAHEMLADIARADPSC